MSRRSKVRGGFMPDYASYCMDGMCSFKVYYDGVFCHGSKPEQTRYVGGSSDFFDFAKPSTMGMVDLWSFALQLGYPNPNNIRFWHKNGDSLHMGRYLESDADVCSIANHIPKDFIVELFIEESGFTSMKILPTQESQVESAIDEVQAEEEEEEEEEELPTDERGKEKQLAPMNLQLRDIPDDVDLGDEPNIPHIPPSESTNAETESSPVVESNNAGNQAPVVVPEVPPITQTQGSTSGAGTNSSERVVIAPPNKKLPVRRPEKRNSNTTSAVNVQVSGGSAIKTPVIVKGGVNFITVSNLRASFGQGATAGSSRSTQCPNTASAGSSPNTAPISSEPTTRKKPFRAPRPSNDLK